MKPQSGLRHSWKRGVWGKPVFHPQAALEGLPGALLGFPLGEQERISQRKVTKPQMIAALVDLTRLVQKLTKVDDAGKEF
jgi:hypothetical protein